MSTSKEKITKAVSRAIALKLNVAFNDILEIRAWAHVFWVRVKGQRPTLVSKKSVIGEAKKGDKEVVAWFLEKFVDHDPIEPAQYVIDFDDDLYLRAIGIGLLTQCQNAKYCHVSSIGDDLLW